MTDYKELTAPCGLDCFNCEIQEKKITAPMQKMMAEKLGKPENEIPCKGCRTQNGCKLHGNCATLDCIAEKGLDFCHECNEFPCTMLQPCAQGADAFPHNFKVFNLCRIKAIGVENWAKNEALTIRKKYFKGKFIPGTGPVLD